jgi:hypothetical protein
VPPPVPVSVSVFVVLHALKDPHNKYACTQPKGSHSRYPDEHLCIDTAIPQAGLTSHIIISRATKQRRSLVIALIRVE